MSNNLRQLQSEANAFANSLKPVGTTAWREIYDNKLASLIVNECNRLVDQYIRDCGEVASLPYRILEDHFGV